MDICTAYCTGNLNFFLSVQYVSQLDNMYLVVCSYMGSGTPLQTLLMVSLYLCIYVSLFFISLNCNK